MEMEVDGRDIEILRLLQRDAKMSVKEIGEKLGCPVTTAFILASFTYRAPGIERPLDQRQIAREVARFPEVQEVHIITGDWDILIKVKDRDVASIGRFVIDKLRTIEGIEKTLTCMVFDTLKETPNIQLPEAPKEGGRKNPLGWSTS
jgi:DNA-binding Lrp family transcriptional regulator